MKPFLLLGLFLLGAGTCSLAQKANNYSIQVQFFPEKAQMWGYPVSNNSFMRGSAKVQLSDSNTEKPSFYLHGELKIDSIVSNGKNITFSEKKVFYGKDYSHVGLETTLQSSDITSDNTLDIYYSGFFNPSRARSLSDYFYIDKKDGVYLRSYYYSPWFPIFENATKEDYVANFKKVTVKLPKDFRVVVSGNLIEETISGNLYTVTWKPGPTHISSLQCAARTFKVLKDDNIFIHYVSAPKNAKKIMDFTSNLKKLYFNKLKSIQNTSQLHIIELPEYGNISSQNVIGISTDVYENFEDKLYSKLTIAHELVHPYTSIPVTKNHPFYALVIEGFPSFFHLYGMSKILNDQGFDIKEYMQRTEKSYLKKRSTGEDRRGNPLPIEKSILEIRHNEIGKYKDLFILSDRVRLFLYHLWTTMGEDSYDQFLNKLFNLDTIDYDIMKKIVEEFIPDYGNNLNIWLNTIDYPKSIQLKN
ncbi:hypothetical protein [uncultured Croceitalea sp.]|uniref:hypothetical protein n=1 Tax=uncultured Croceitalea sp. TaxID=1798908 RepID=UPI00330625EF